MDPVTTYARWVARQNVPPCITELLQSLPFSTISQRKVSLAFSRVRPYNFGPSSFFYREFRNELHEWIVYESYDHNRRKSYVEQNTLRSLLEPILPFAQDYSLMALLSTGARQAPYTDYTSVSQTFDKTLRKEIDAATDMFSNIPLSYGPIFSLASFDPMSPHLPYSPTTARKIYVALQSCKDRLRNTLLIPRVSTKTVGLSAQELSKPFLEDGECGITEILTLADVEIVYMKREGLRLPGVVEMRSAWKYNDLKPRVYYAQGPEVYYASRYIQAVCNILVDSLECVHRTFRYYLPSAAEMSIRDRIFTYDYSSFTSRLRELPAFVDALASFLEDVEVNVLDTSEGIITMNLGEMMAEYNQACNYKAQFSVERMFPDSETTLFEHATGMLGVPGNISLSTLLHGIHLCCLLSDDELGKCVGDDSIGMLRNGRDKSVWDEFLYGVGALGDIAREKFTYWDSYASREDTAWQYLKRPVRIILTHLYLENAFMLPGLELILEIEDDFHVPLRKSFADRQITFIRQWSRFLTRLRYYPQYLTPEGRMFLTGYQHHAYHLLELKSRDYVLLTRSQGSSMCVLYPAVLPSEMFGGNWIEYTSPFWKRADTEIRLPAMQVQDLEYRFEEVGDTMITRSSPLIKVMENLRLVKTKMVMEVVELEEIDSWVLEQWIEMRFPVSYEVVALEQIPAWYEQCRQYLLMSPHEHSVAYPPEWLLEVEDDT